jgi:RNA polymerase sigma-70 factor (ECF subfamily)
MYEERERRWRAWMIEAQSGDTTSYEKLLLELLPHLRGFVRRRLGDRGGLGGVAGLEDVVQNVCLSIHRARHTYRSERPFAPWLHAVARNAVIDHVRAQARRTRREISIDAEGVPEPAAQAPRQVALSRELTRALAEIPPRQREAVELIQLRELSVAEAAARVGVSQTALKVRAHRGYRALRACLAKSPT